MTTRNELAAIRDAQRKPILTLDFWIDAGERAAVTFAEVGLGFLVVGAGFASVDWLDAASVAGVAALASVLKSVVATRIGTGSASLAPRV
ncbi:holin [Microbacterium phage Cen1621]|uniref:Holin n=1 Tax=Microbacterium phage Cen1621 TaxID=2965191 RepID=A0A9E7QC36_9CAUD|nr:holin [Microbacterium phage Cen1621]